MRRASVSVHSGSSAISGGGGGSDSAPGTPQSIAPDAAVVTTTSPFVSAKAKTGEVSPDTVAMPSELRVIGIAEEGCTLRAWAPEGEAVLGRVRFAWFRAHPAAAKYVHAHVF